MTLLLANVATVAQSALDGLPVKTLTLDQYEDQAIEKGIQGRLTELALDIAGYSRNIAFRQTDSPTVVASHEATRAESQVNGIKQRADTRTSTIEVDQPTVLGTQINAKGLYGNANDPGLTASVIQPLYLFTWNAPLRTRKRAELNFSNARDTFDSTILSLRAQARSLYYDAMLGEESIKVEERKATSSKKLLEITQALVDAGKTAPVETMRAKIRAQTDERKLQNAVTTRDIAVLNAKNFVFLPIEEPIQFTTRLSFKPFNIALDRLVDHALIHRPELRSLRRERELAWLATQEAIEPGRPALTVNSTYGYNELSNRITKSWSFGGQVRWLLFDGFVTRDRVRVARVNEWVADLNISNSERTTRVDVENAYMNVRRSEKQIQAFEFSREQAKRNVEVLRLRFQNGLERLIDVFDAENEMRNLDNEYLSTLVGYNRAKDNLSQLVGADVETLR